MQTTDIKELTPLGQHCLIERDKETSDWMQSKSGIFMPTGVVEDEGLVFGTVISAPEDQNLLIDKTRPINSITVEKYMKVWYSKYSAKRVIDWRKKDGSMLDVVPLEDLMAVVRT
jgi:co-chaperonin GroES (HSP10)